MNWDAFGAIAELLGAVAVFLTLIYLALQMRHSAKAVAAQTYESIMSGYNEINIARAANPKLASLFVVGLQTPEELSKDEVHQFDALLTCYAVNYTKIHRLYKNGVIEKSELRMYASEASVIFGYPGGCAFLDRNPNWHHLNDILKNYQYDPGEIDILAAQHLESAEKDANSLQ